MDTSDERQYLFPPNASGLFVTTIYFSTHIYSFTVNNKNSKTERDFCKVSNEDTRLTSTDVLLLSLS